MPVSRSLLALTVSASLLASACSASGAVIATGAVGMITGGVIMAQQTESGCMITYPNSCAAEDIGAGLNNGANLLLGGMILALSAVVLTAGVVGAVHDELEHSDAATPDAKLVLTADREEVELKVVEHIQIASRTHRCHVAQLFADKLTRLDDARLRALIEDDRFVESCLRDWTGELSDSRTN